MEFEAWSAESLTAQAVARQLLESASAAGIPRQPADPQAGGPPLEHAGPGHAGLNPLEPAVGLDGDRFPLQGHARLVRALFLAAFGADEPFPQVLTSALLRCYEQAGWDLVSGRPSGPAQAAPAYPALSDLRVAALTVIEDAGFDRATAEKARGLVSEYISPRLCAGGQDGDDRFRAFINGVSLIRRIENPVNSAHFPERPSLTATA